MRFSSLQPVIFPCHSSRGVSRDSERARVPETQRSQASAVSPPCVGRACLVRVAVSVLLLFSGHLGRGGLREGPFLWFSAGPSPVVPRRPLTQPQACWDGGGGTGRPWLVPGASALAPLWPDHCRHLLPTVAFNPRQEAEVQKGLLVLPEVTSGDGFGPRPECFQIPS